ncbi:ABC transporter family substrate-binding protein [Streptomyces niveus]|uniref:ABC transporter family substrate-binding protein n=1 Tax=Streptomyces niveus TaxID=193462 RepID=UPI0033AE0A2A
MSKVGAPRGRTCSRTIRSVALITTGVLALPALASCSSGDERSEVPAAAQDVGPAERDRIADGGTLRWAVDTVPTTLNTFQADADATTSRVAGAVLPSLFTLDKTGRPQRNPDYLESAKIVEREPKQVVLYKLNQQAVWSDGRELGAPDFVAQWRALSGKDSAYWTARNAGYERIQKIERGADDLEVRVTFNKPYADWRGLFSPLYPKDVMGAPNSFNDGARNKLKATAGPFQLKELDREDRQVTLVRNPRWWGARPKLDSIVLSAVSRDKRAAALADGTLDLAEIDSPVAERIKKAAHEKGGAGPGPQSATGPASAAASPSAADDSDDQKAEAAKASRKKADEAIAKYAKEQKGLRAYVVRKSLEPAFTQLALNGETGPLADERVRRAVARALDRQKLAEAVLKPLGLPANPPGSHLALAGQQAYADSSDALGEQNTQEAQGLLADAGWTPGGPLKKDDGTKAGSEADADKKKDKDKEKTKSEEEDGTKKDKEGDTESGSGSGPESASDGASESPSGSPSASASESGSESDPEGASDEGAYIVGDNKPGRGAPVSGTGARVMAPAHGTAFQRAVLTGRTEPLNDSDVNAQDRQPGGGGMAGAYAPSGTAAPSSASASASGSASASASASASVSASASASASTSASASALPGPLAKDGKPLTLRFVLPSGSGSEQLRTVGEKIARMLDRIGIRTEITKVADANYFKDHIASGDYDLALYSWPATAYPATDGRPIYAKPVPASDGSLLVEQNYTRVGTDHINQLFDQAASELDEKAAHDLLRQADARIWAAAGSIPLYQRPQLVAAKPSVANAGAFAFASPRYEDIGFKNNAKSGPQNPAKSAEPEKSPQAEEADKTQKPEAAESESDE